MVLYEISGIQLVVCMSSVSNVKAAKNPADDDVFQGFF